MLRRLLRLAAPIALAALAWLPAAARAESFGVTNLVTDDQTVNPALLTDASLRNPWGVAYGPAGPFWVSANGSGVSTIYSVDPATDVPAKNALEVAIPGAGNVTGQAFDPRAGAGDFNGDSFLFASEDGTISGWRPALGSTAEALDLTNGVYKGAATGVVGGFAYLYAANFSAADIDVLAGNASASALPGSFTDPNLPAGFAPFNVQNLGDTLYVSYAVVGQDGNEVDAPGNGIVDAFDLQGNLLRRIAGGGDLNAPWGLAIAPAAFGPFAGSLLVGNAGDGRIHAFDPLTGTPLGALTDGSGDPIAIDGLWALTPGNGGSAGSPDEIYFTAGPQRGTHGLFGAIAMVPEPDTLVLLESGLLGMAWAGRRSPQKA